MHTENDAGTWGIPQRYEQLAENARYTAALLRAKRSELANLLIFVTDARQIALNA